MQPGRIAQRHRDVPDPAAEAAAATLDYSIVVEWENIRLAEASRATSMLQAISRQMQRLARSGVNGELLLVCDEDDEPRQRALADEARTFWTLPAVQLRVLSVIEARYYEKKNAGAAAAIGAIILFLDSDVVPEADWLSQMLAPFTDSSIDVVGGATHVEPASAYARAVAAFWFFAPRRDDTGLGTLEAVYANNLAFRRAVFLAHGFPTRPTFRGQATELIRTLRSHGAGVVLQRGARCEHPPPNGLLHFVRHGICDGHDQMRAAAATVDAPVPWRHTFSSVHWVATAGFERIRARSAALGLTAPSRAVARIVATIYAISVLVGHLLTRWRPGFVPKHLPI